MIYPWIEHEMLIPNIYNTKQKVAIHIEVESSCIQPSQLGWAQLEIQVELGAVSSAQLLVLIFFSFQSSSHLSNLITQVLIISVKVWRLLLISLLFKKKK
jgi:hypothetical protein